MPATARAESRDAAFRALSGAQAARFSMPGDMVRVKSISLSRGLLYQRFQQLFGARKAEVLGAEITVYMDASGTPKIVIGAHYRDIRAKNSVAVSAAEARAVSVRDIGQEGRRITDLMIDPSTGRYFYRVETRRLASRWVHWVDAGSRRVIKRFNSIENLSPGQGLGVRGDTKSMSGLTTFHGSSGHGATGAHYDLFSTDNRQFTYDARGKSTSIYYATDSNNAWDTPGRTYPGQRALVDAQYYANATDDYYQNRFGLNWKSSCYGAGMQSVAHYKRNYTNAFWNGTYVIYGDGDGTSFREFSGGLDVVAHEHTHGVSDCTWSPVYSGESGALDESFSDILGNSAEFYAAANGVDPTVSPDWKVGEDIYLTPDDVAGFRNMADPREDNDPDHYSERQIGGGDNGGVHTNSLIPSHAYYLLVNGGKNAGCDSVGSNGHTHTADCNVTVTGIGLSKAEQIFLVGFTGLPSTGRLPSDASMCQARLATEAAANSLYGAAEQASTTAAWDAVGVPSNCGSPPPPPSSTYRDAILGTSGLVSYWRLAETSGTTAADSKGTNNCTYTNGVLLGQPGALLSESNPAVRLDGTDDYVNCSPTPFGTPSNFSVEAWIKLDTQKGTGGKHTIVTDSFDDYNDGFSFSVDDLNKLSLTVASNSTTKSVASSASALALNTWYHVVGTYDGAAVRLYINGSLDSSTAYSSGITYNSSRDLQLGKQVKSFNQSIRFLDGALDEVALYNTALSATTVQNHYTAAGY